MEKEEEVEMQNADENDDIGGDENDDDHTVVSCRVEVMDQYVHNYSLLVPHTI